MERLNIVVAAVVLGLLTVLGLFFYGLNVYVNGARNEIAPQPVVQGGPAPSDACCGGNWGWTTFNGVLFLCYQQSGGTACVREEGGVGGGLHTVTVM